MLAKIKKYYPYILLLLSALILFIKTRYSFCWSDETFYFSTTYRFYQGDSIFLHDWFPTQLSSIILLPIFTLFVKITGSTDGVILFFRQLFVIVSLINAICLFNMLKNRTKELIALLCSLCLLFYTHLNIATLSYYTISVQCYLMAMVCTYYYYSNKKKRYLVISGILFAISVLALPTMAAAYVLVVILGLILVLIVKKLRADNSFRKFIDSLELVTIFKYTLAGIMIPAIIFFIFLLTNVSIKDFIAAIPYVLSDEEHVTDLIYPFKKFFIGINEVYGYTAYAGYLLILVSFIIHPFKLASNKQLKMYLFLADVLLFIDYFICSINHTGYIQTAILLFALPLFFLNKNRDRHLFFLFFASGLIFSMVFSYSSNGYLYILSMGHFIAPIGGILTIYDFAVDALNNQHRDIITQSGTSTCIQRNFGTICYITCIAFLLVGTVQTMTLRLNNIYRDAPLLQLDSKIEKGPAKGLYTTNKHMTQYNEIYDTITRYCTSQSLGHEGNIFITKLLPFGYMCTDLRCASPTSWRTQFNSQRLQPYYEMNPDRYPDIIFVVDEEYGSYLTCGDVVEDPNPNANEIGGFLLEYVNANNYTESYVPGGTLYRKTIID